MRKLILSVAIAFSMTTSPLAALAQAAHYTTEDTEIGALLADTAAKAVVEKQFPGLTTSDSIQMASSMTLRQLQQFKPDIFTDEALNKTDEELAKLPLKK